MLPALILLSFTLCLGGIFFLKLLAKSVNFSKAALIELEIDHSEKNDAVQANYILVTFSQCLIFNLNSAKWINKR